MRTGGIYVSICIHSVYFQNESTRTNEIHFHFTPTSPHAVDAQFYLKNHEFTFDVDVSKLPCGLNGALYFVAMDEDGGMSAYPNNNAGAKYGRATVTPSARVT